MSDATIFFVVERQTVNGYECIAGALAAMLLMTVGKFLNARQSAGQLPPTIDAGREGALQSVYPMLVLSALAFLCKDALIWTWYVSLSSLAFEQPFWPWQLLFGALSGINLGALALPLLFEKKLKQRYGSDRILLANMALVFLWLSNILITYILWGAFCDFCYFG